MAAEQLNKPGHQAERVKGELTPWGKFAQHRRDAKGRGITFELNFDTWWSIWQQSGHFLNRGSKRGQYVMARFKDMGPYAVGNVKIVVVRDNHREAHVGRACPKSLEHRRKLSEAHKGKVLSEQTKRAISAGLRGKYKGVRKTDAHRKALSLAMKGRKAPPKSVAARKKLSMLMTKRWQQWRIEHGR